MGRRILVPLDGSPAAEAAISEAVRLATPDADIHLLHVVPPLPMPAGADPTRTIELHEQAEEYLEHVRAWMSRFEGANIVLSGDPADGILKMALELNADLIAMCTHTRAGLARWIVGSVAEVVVRKSWLPVLLTKPGARAPRSELRRILVPLDGSAHSLAILETVKLIAARTGAEVILLHVAENVLDPAPQWASKGPSSSLEVHRHHSEEIADQLEEAGLTSWAVVAEGEPAAEVLRQARTLEADLIAMATHGRTGLERAIVGSVAEGVLRGADRAVLLQRPIVHRKYGGKQP